MQIIAVVAFVAGVCGAWLVHLKINAKVKADLAGQIERASQLEKNLTEKKAELEKERAYADRLRTDLVQFQSDKAVLDTRMEELSRKVTEQKDLLSQAEAQLTHAFRSLAADALSKNNSDFLELATQRFAALRTETIGELETRKTAIEGLVAPFSQTLSKLEEQTQQLEVSRVKQMTSLEIHLQDLAQAQINLQSETSRLVNALRKPHVRGRWGQIALRKTAELAGMSQYCDFREEVTVSNEDGTFRPDMIVDLPSGRQVIVDAKVSLSAYLEALEAETDNERQAAMRKHAQQIKQHVKNLAQKSYWQQFEKAPEFVVMFIPDDSFLAAAAEQERDLIEYALENHVVIATPTTFIALLKAMAYGWKQAQLAESTKEISELGKDLGDRIATFIDHLNMVGADLSGATQSYNSAVASLQTRVIPQARKFKELGAEGKKEIPDLKEIEIMPIVFANGSE